MPLGILLAAAWIELLSPAEVAVEIERSLDFLETGWRDVPHRQRSLRGVFDHSWALLTDREREAFRRLSVFRGGFTREAAEQVGASLRDLRGLVGKSFLQQSTDARRYDVHELLRQYGSEKLAGSPEDSASARDGHAAHFAVALESFVDDMRGPRQQEAVAEIEAESENLRVAWMWAVERGRVDWLDHGIEGLARFYWRRGRYQEGEAAFRAASDRLSAGAGPALRPSDSAAPSGHRLRVMAKVLAWQGFFTYALGRRQLAREMQQESLALLERPELANEDTRAEQAMLYQQMGQIVLVTDYKLSGQLQEQSLALYRTLDDPWSEADALHHLGYASKFRGAYVDARAALEECLKSFEALGDYEGTAWVTASLADVAVDQGRFEEAERLARDSRARLQALGEPEGIGFGLLALGVALEHQGKFVEARSALAESLSTFDELGRPGWTNDTRAALSRVNLGLGQYQEARTHARTFLALARDAGVQYRVGLALFTLGGVALVEEAYAEARRLLREGLIIYREAGPPPAAVWAHALMAYAARGLGEPALARDRLAEALGAFSETGSVPYLLWSLPAAALVLADQGACHRAIEVYALASRYPLVGKSRWFDDVAGRWIAAVAAALPPREAAAARERGRALDLEATQEALLGELREAEHEPG
jgi:tetratricopeptide (TPR) repeat protein